MSQQIQRNPWEPLQQYTAARIALGRVGASLPTREVLRFGLAHAQARDAVHIPLDVPALSQALERAGFATLVVQSRCPDRPSYLMRPDWGRSLHPDSLAQLPCPESSCEFAIVIGDGLSSLAVQQHALPLVQALRDRLPLDWTPRPIVIAQQARVALADVIGERLQARLILMLIGERPGLSSPDSLGVYVTYDPRPGCHDGQRNCISNIRPEGLPIAVAAQTLSGLMQQALLRGLTGIGLKEDTPLASLR